MTTPIANSDAVDVAEQAGKETGSDSAQSVGVSCSVFRMGVFFDGTGNSRKHVGEDKISWNTNVNLLEHVYKKTSEEDKEEIVVEGKKMKYASSSVYMRGIGVTSDGKTTVKGMGHGTGEEGVESRVNQSYGAIASKIRETSPDMEPCEIWFDVFGFSRGSVAARDFANGIKDGEFSSSSQLNIKFMGIYDCVGSMGEGGHTGNHGNVKLNTSPKVAEKIYHVTSCDEIRQYFPLTRAYNEDTIEVVGVHSDIGGGYYPEKSSHKNQKLYYNGAQYSDVMEVIRNKWDFYSGSTEYNGTSVTYKNPYGDTLKTSSVQGSVSSFVFENKVQHGIQFVTLRLMYDNAVKAGVPFESLGESIEGISISLDNDLQGYYEALTRGVHTKEMETRIRSQYAHMSAHTGQTAYVVEAHLPEKNGIRRIDQM